jgi:hypothetical protein
MRAVKSTLKMPGEVLHQDLVHRGAQGRGVEALLVDLHIVAGEDHVHDRGIGAGATDAQFLQGPDQAFLGKAGRRFGEVLTRVHPVQLRLLPLVDVGGNETIVPFLGLLAFRQFALGQFGVAVDPQKALVHQHPARGPEGEAAPRQVDGALAIPGGHHLAGHGPVPDQLVQAQLVLGQVGVQALRHQVDAGGANRLVGVLGALPSFI